MESLLESGQQLDDNFTGLAVRLAARLGRLQLDAPNRTCRAHSSLPLLCRTHMASLASLGLVPSCQKAVHDQPFQIFAAFVPARLKVIGAYLHTQRLCSFSGA